MCRDQLYNSDTCSEFLHDGFCKLQLSYFYMYRNSKRLEKQPKGLYYNHKKINKGDTQLNR